MEIALLIIAALLLATAIFLFSRAWMMMSELKRLKEEISQIKNIGDLLNVTESTLDDANQAISTARKVIDRRINKMEELMERFDEMRLELESSSGKSNSKPSTSHKKISPKQKPNMDISSDDIDKAEREHIAKRNRRIILMLEENIPIEEIARETNASVREIQLIQKFIR